MSKFGLLISNEWRKQFKKKTVWVFLILTIVASLGFGLIFGAIESLDYDFEYKPSTTFAEDCDSEIEYYQVALEATIARKDSYMTEEEYQDEVDYFENAIAQWTFYKSLGIETWSDWRFSSGFAEELWNIKDEVSDAKFQEYLNGFKSKNIETYYRIAFADDYAQVVKDDRETANVWFADYCIEYNVIPTRNDWRYGLLLAASDAYASALSLERQQSLGFPIDESTLQKKHDAVTLATYRVENDIAALPSDSLTAYMGTSILEPYSGETSLFWDISVMELYLVSVIAIFILVLAGTIVANEYTSGTIKFLVLSPVKRWKILAAKYVTVLILGVMLLAGVFVSGLLCGLIFNASGARLVNVSVVNGVVKTSSPYLMILKQYLLSGVKILVIASLSFALSSICKNNALAIAASLGCYYLGNTILTIGQLFRLDFLRYSIFANMDFSAVVNGTTGFPHHTLACAIISVVLHMAVFLLTAWDGFTRREM
ncbi:MAG: ABC transporter permease [Clostridia bacterium]|nr:ABC transporter permease [Clostridia bacterium]